MLLPLLLIAPALAAGTCTADEATARFQAGFEAQRAFEIDDALENYNACLELEPGCIPCQYEIGWSYWSKHDFKKAAAAWEATLKLDPDHKHAAKYKVQAEQQASGGVLSATGLRVPLHMKSSGDGVVKLELVGRIQNYNKGPTDDDDHLDPDLWSPKSARFSADGKKVYINSLEGWTTAVYDAETLERLKLIKHVFTDEHAELFNDETTVFGYEYNRMSETGNPNHFNGKPVESALSHDGRYLWVPYYRRHWDRGGTSPSAVSIIDTTTDEIVRVMPTGPIPKYVAPSPDGKWLAITHWGDNTLAILDISSDDPDAWHYLEERLVVDKVLPMSGLAHLDRDSACGHCLRGTVWTPDGDTLLVARMGTGGIAGFKASDWSYLGTVTGEQPTPRHLAISPEGEWLYVSSNKSGTVARIPLKDVLAGLEAGGAALDGWENLKMHGSARTIELSKDGKLLFVAVNSSNYLAAIDTESWEEVARVRTDAYPVGLDVSHDGSRVWTTAQGKHFKDGHKGGNSVCVFDVTVTADETPAN